MKNTSDQASEKPTQGESTRREARVPWWMYVVIVVAMAPGLAFPWLAVMIQSPNPVIRGLAWFYPAYVLCSGLLAWMCYGRRTLMCWIIIVLLVLSHLCILSLKFLP